MESPGAGLRELRQALAGYARRFDPALISCTEAEVAVKEAAAIENIAATIKAMAAARAAQARQWRTEGHRSAEEHLAQTTGISVAQAKDTLERGRAFDSQPEVADAARSGDLSPAQVSAISDAVADNPDAAGELLAAAAGGGSLGELKNRCADIKAAAADREANRERIHRRRSLRSWTDPTGEAHLHARGNPEDIAQVMAALAPLAQRVFNVARLAGRRESPDAYRFDALIELAVNATSASDDPPEDDDKAEPAGAEGTGDGGETVEPAGAGGPSRKAADSTGLPQPTDAAPMLWPAGPYAERSDATVASPGDRPAGADAPEPNVGAAPSRSTQRAPGGDPHPHTTEPASPATATKTRRGGKRRTQGPPRTRRGAPAKLLLRVDLQAFLRGFPTTGETCELVGYGPIAVSAVHDILKRADPFIAAIFTRGHEVAGVAHLGRKPTAYQQSALEWLYPTCAAAGCPATARLEKDHRLDWSATHLTLLDWLDLLCAHHHQLKTRHNWSLTTGYGKRPFVPPTDPRHPDFHTEP
jgi:hypothetical protein